MTEPTLTLDRLTTDIDTPRGSLRAVDEVSYTVRRGETLGVVGESGSGKSMTVLSILGLLPRGARVVGGRAMFGDRDLLTLTKRSLRRIRGRDIAMVFQDPMTSLNPVLTVGFQVQEALRAHDRELRRPELRRRAIELLDRVGIPGADKRAGNYPHEFSGGMRQRVMIAMAMANRPSLLIADEPTTALDVTIQAQVLELLKDAREETGAATILITHDLGLLAEMADRVVVMYAGRVVEIGVVDTIFHEPRHPYTLGLMSSRPTLSVGDNLVPIPGQPPDLLELPGGCALHPRCALRKGRQQCVEEPPPLYDAAPEHLTACHYHGELAPPSFTHPRRGGSS